MIRKDIYSNIAKVLSKEATTQEISEVEEWKKKSDSNKKLFSRYEAIWNQTHLVESFSNQEEIFKVIQKKITEDYEEDIFRDRYWTGHKVSDFIRIGLAASIGLIMMVSLLFLPYRSDKQNLISESVIITKENTTRQKSSVPLPDGSIVWLNAESSIRFPTTFNGNVRRVELIGEAFFEVANDASKPFEVETDNLITRALGTSFNVRYYKNQKRISVFLNSGKIMVSDSQNALKDEVLEPGYGLAYDIQNKTVTKFKDFERNKIAWKDGILKFHNADLESVIEELSLWYGVNIEINGSPGKDWKYTGTYQNEFLINVLNSMAYGKNLSYEIDEEKVVITFK